MSGCALQITLIVQPQSLQFADRGAVYVRQIPASEVEDGLHTEQFAVEGNQPALNKSQQQGK